MLKLKQILTSKRTQNEAIEFLDNYKIDYEKFQKGDEFIISLNSFALTYNGNGVLISTDEH